MEKSEKQKIEDRNKLITRAILVSQLQDHEGFKVFMDDTEDVLKGYKFQDVRGIKTVDDLNRAQGYVQAVEDIKNYFEGQKRWAMKPMVNPDTGEEEILNENKEV